jgi:hypothetical protein
VDSLKTIGTKINKQQFTEHRWIADLLYFEGPLLSLFKGSKDQDYFYHWCESDSIASRWLAIPVTRKDIEDYFAHEKSLLSIIKKQQRIFFIDANNEGTPNQVFSVKSEAIPSAYTVPETSYFDEDLCPTDIYKTIKPSTYAIKIDKNWFFDEFSLVERVFTQLYSFVYGLTNMDGLVARDKVRRAFQQYPWKGGFSAVHFYDNMRAAVPSLHEPKVGSIVFQSPGTIKLELLESVATNTGLLIKHFNENSVEILEQYEEARKYLRDAGLLKIDENLDIKSILTDASKKAIKDHFADLARSLNMAEFSEQIEEMTGNPLISLKILLSFCRRVMKLNKLQDDGKLEFTEANT